MDKQKKVFLIVSVILALIVGLSLYNYSKAIDDRVMVLVAAKDIESGIPITNTMLKSALVHSDNILKGAFVNKDSLVGKQVAVKIFKDEQVIEGKLLADKDKKSNSLAYTLAPGRAALGIKTSSVNAVGGLIKKGDKVILSGISPSGTVSKITDDAYILKVISKSNADLDEKDDKLSGDEAKPEVVVVDIQEGLIDILSTSALDNELIISLQARQ